MMKTSMIVSALMLTCVSARADTYNDTCTRSQPARDGVNQYYVEWSERSAFLFIHTERQRVPVRYVVDNVDRNAWPLVIVSGVTPVHTRFSMVFVDHAWTPGKDDVTPNETMINIDERYALPDLCNTPE